MKKFLWPAVAVLVMGLLGIAFLTGALYGKTTGEKNTNETWYKSVNGAIQVMRDLDSGGKKEALSSMIQKINTRLKLAAPEESPAIVKEAARGYAQ